MHSERCTSGSARGHAKLPVARPALRACSTQPYIATDEGWLFLAVVIDLFSRQVVGWSLRQDMRRDIVIDALRMAWFKRHPIKQAGLIFHSDSKNVRASCSWGDLTLTAMDRPGAGAARCRGWPDPHSDRPRAVSFPGPVGRPGISCGEALPRRCV